MKKTTISLSMLISFTLTGCVTPEMVKKSINNSSSPQFTSDACFDIGIWNTNMITDDYWEALGVNNGIECTKAIAERTQLTPRERVVYIQKSLTISSHKTFLSSDVLTNINTEISFQEKKLNEFDTEKAQRELELKKQEEREIAKRNKEKEIELAKRQKEIAISHKKWLKKKDELCGKNGLTIGDSEACMFHVKGNVYNSNTTVTKYGTRVQYKFLVLDDDGFHDEYIYVENGRVTIFQY